MEKIVIITKRTVLEELVQKFNSKEQAKFYIEHSGSSFDEYQKEHDAYQTALSKLMKVLPLGLKQQVVDRAFLPNFLFGPKDLIVTLGPDGLVINTAKYLNGQPILAVNPDKKRIDGILMPFDIDGLTLHLFDVIARGNYSLDHISIAYLKLNDGQEMYGVNDIFVGPKSQISFRYCLKQLGIQENQCSSGIIVSTGAGSTGWFKSIVAGARAITESLDSHKITASQDSRFPWNSDYLNFCVREPFQSKTSGVKYIFGKITKDSPLYVTSQTPQGAVIFSDGIENDFLEFGSGKAACICVADKKANLIRQDVIKSSIR